MTQWLWPTDVRRAGALHLWLLLIGAATAAIAGAAVQLEAWTPASDVFEPQVLGQWVDAHGQLFTLLTLAAFPLVLGHLALPRAGATETAVPTVSALVFWLWLAGLLFATLTLFSSGSPGWHFYSPHGAGESPTRLREWAMASAWMALALGSIDICITWLRRDRLKLLIAYPILLGGLLALGQAVWFLVSRGPLLFGSAEMFDPALGGDPYPLLMAVDGDGWFLVTTAIPASLVAIDALIRGPALRRILGSATIVMAGTGLSVVILLSYVAGRDIHLHDTMIVVAVPHALAGATWLSLLASTWRPGRAEGPMTVIAIVLGLAAPTSIAAYIMLGYEGMPRRYASHIEVFSGLQQTSTLAALVAALTGGALALVVALRVSAKERSS